MVHSLVCGNDRVVSIIDPSVPEAYTEINEETIGEADTVIDFSNPAAVVENVRLAASLFKNIVVGTTGWHENMLAVRNIVEERGIGFLYASNFAIGVQLFLRLIRRAGELFNFFPQYDVFVHEFHHRQKADSPSGTALSIAQTLTRTMERKTGILTQTSEGRIPPEKLHVTSTRGGFIPGTHHVVFDSEADTIELRHEARSRAGFAAGAIECARWLVGRRGFFTIDDFLENIIK